jgi:alkylation response protein AidB-like acyl-CoA dehydrogenase
VSTFALAASFDLKLGAHPSMGLAEVVRRDEAETYPDEACQALDALGLGELYIPRSEGGELGDLADLGAVLRVVTRRDLTVAITHVKTFVGLIHHWVAGSPAQRRRAAELIRDGARVSLAYHEETHGSDHLAAETTATRDGDGFVLAGTKWCVNNLAHSRAATFFARTSPSGGPKGFSLLFVERDRGGTWGTSRGLRTLGMRGGDFSSATLEGVRVGADAVIGPVGDGHSIAMRSFQITRSLFSDVALGAADTALRLVTSFARDRRVYGRRVIDIPHPRRALAGVFADLLLWDATTRFTWRALHTLPSDMRLLSALGKQIGCGDVDDVMRRLAHVLGARSYLREGHWGGLFQKIARDVQVLPVFHAGGFTLGATIGMHLQRESEEHARGAYASDDVPPPVLLALGDGELPAFSAEWLLLLGDGGNPLLRSLRACATALAGRAPGLAALATAVVARVDEHFQRTREVVRARGPAFSISAELFELACEHARLHACAAALGHVATRPEIDDVATAWVELAVRTRLGSLYQLPLARRDDIESVLLNEVVRLSEGNMLFGLEPFTLGSFGPEVNG